MEKSIKSIHTVKKKNIYIYIYICKKKIYIYTHIHIYVHTMFQSLCLDSDDHGAEKTDLFSGHSQYRQGAR